MWPRSRRLEGEAEKGLPGLQRGWGGRGSGLVGVCGQGSQGGRLKVGEAGGH